MDSLKTRHSVYDVPYQHQTWNHLFFDRIRTVQLDIELMKAYLVDEERSRTGGAGLLHEIEALSHCSSLLFDEVYSPLRDKWL